MKINNNPQPKSSFLSMEKDMSLIFNMILRNPRLKKLLYYTTPTCLDKLMVPDEEAIKMIGKNLRIIPKEYIEPNIMNSITISFDKFVPNALNPEFRNNVIVFDIACHFSQWQLKDFQLRPYKIAAEIDSMFNKKHLTGIGLLQFLGAEQFILNDELSGVSLSYRAIHGEEDKIDMLNPADQEQFEQDFKELMGLEE